LFWDDTWLGDFALRDKYPRLFANSNLKHATLESLGIGTKTDGYGSLNREESGSNEKNHLIMQCRTNYRGVLVKDSDDEWQWKDEEIKVYTVKFAYKKLQNGIKGEDEVFYDKFWRIKALPIIKHFAWRMMLNKVATYNNLYNIGIELGTRMCVMCGNNEEIISHLFFSCRATNYIRKMCDYWVWISFGHHE